MTLTFYLSLLPGTPMNKICFGLCPIVFVNIEWSNDKFDSLYVVLISLETPIFLYRILRALKMLKDRTLLWLYESIH